MPIDIPFLVYDFETTVKLFRKLLESKAEMIDDGRLKPDSHDFFDTRAILTNLALRANGYLIGVPLYHHDELLGRHVIHWILQDQTRAYLIPAESAYGDEDTDNIRFWMNHDSLGILYEQYLKMKYSFHGVQEIVRVCKHIKKKTKRKRMSVWLSPCYLASRKQMADLSRQCRNLESRVHSIDASTDVTFLSNETLKKMLEDRHLGFFAKHLERSYELALKQVEE
jgi:hypothetical protein